MSKNQFAKRLMQNEDYFFKAGFQAGLQKASDMYDIVLNDADVMGKGVIGFDRILKIRLAVEEASSYYAPAYDRRHVEADVFQERLDAKLRRVWRDKFAPFAERYPMLKKIKY